MFVLPGRKVIRSDLDFGVIDHGIGVPAATVQCVIALVPNIPFQIVMARVAAGQAVIMHGAADFEEIERLREIGPRIGRGGDPGGEVDLDRFVDFEHQVVAVCGAF